MFFPDKAAGLQEALRVLKPGGTYLFNVWDAIEHNEVCRITHETVAGFFPDNPPQFYTVPFGLHDHETIRRLLTRAGFEQVEHAVVEKTGASPSAAEAATGLIEGNPILGEIMKRRPEALPEIKTGAGSADRPPARRSAGALRSPGARLHGPPPRQLGTGAAG